MERIYEMAGRLSPVISQELAGQAWDEAWAAYVMPDDRSEVWVGSGLTIFRGAGSRDIGDIAYKALYRKVDI